MPKVSAIIPVFNGERFIKDSIESILEQTFNEVEIIVIDDGSTDRTKEFVQSFGQKVIYRRQANAGADKAYNHGISLASGDYVAFLDHDDRWYPAKLEAQVKILTSHPEIGLTYSEVDCIDEDGAPIKRRTWAERRRIRHDLIGDAAAILKRRFPVSVPSAMMFRRDVLQQIGGFDFNLPRSGGHADGKLCILAGEIAKVYFAVKPLVQYRVHQQQMTHLRRQLIHSYRINFLDSLWNHWQQQPEYRALLLPLYGRYWSKEARGAYRRNDVHLAARYLKASLNYRPFNFRTWLWLLHVKLHQLLSPMPKSVNPEDLKNR